MIDAFEDGAEEGEVGLEDAEEAGFSEFFGDGADVVAEAEAKGDEDGVLFDIDGFGDAGGFFAWSAFACESASVAGGGEGGVGGEGEGDRGIGGCALDFGGEVRAAGGDGAEVDGEAVLRWGWRGGD